MRTLHSTLIAAVALATASPAAALAQSSSPVGVASCTVRASTPLSIPGLINAGNFGIYSVSFTDNAAVASNHVGFDVSYDGATRRYDQNGTFATGARIEKNLYAQSYVGYTGDAPTCRVAEVDFVDGTSWHAAPQTALNSTGTVGVANR